ncbi:hypothetical protein BABINDRAFT_168114 [Babjeviella inositovora NRRL Y-12698]|uniref:Uncharacterized protein n=1 Tax=Babjeviella inositovora NRRL Y-12698 TaxID=984486 RepID=A0A1E3QKY0_9ASCO|nr:uncharacterized protein BABINDRAFT_168114 [Babjeviella inositovora NRRL Y-12698]ODQ78359.1 hypothetical protein BABINDRAFT_168114 [Babjeviella inositovora NRRL Y-12698]
MQITAEDALTANMNQILVDKTFDPQNQLLEWHQPLDTPVPHPLNDDHDTVELLMNTVVAQFTQKFSHNAPFSILRITELVLRPLQHYQAHQPEKWLRALQSNVLITSTVDDFRTLREADMENNTGETQTEVHPTDIAMVEIPWLTNGVHKGEYESNGDTLPNKDHPNELLTNGKLSESADMSSEEDRISGKLASPETITPSTARKRDDSEPGVDSDPMRDDSPSPMKKQKLESPESSPTHRTEMDDEERLVLGTTSSDREAAISPTKGEQFLVPDEGGTMHLGSTDIISDEEPLNSPGKYQRV